MAAEADDALFQQGGASSRPAASGPRRMSPVAPPSPAPPASRGPRAATANDDARRQGRPESNGSPGRAVALTGGIGAAALDAPDDRPAPSPPATDGPLGAPKALPDRLVVPAPRPPVHVRPEDRLTGRRPADALDAMPGQRRPQRHPESDPEPPPRPRIVDEPSILGLARWSRGRVGSRAFTVFFVVVYALILMNLIHSLTDP
jgi:hypothetical protein